MQATLRLPRTSLCGWPMLVSFVCFITQGLRHCQDAPMRLRSGLGCPAVRRHFTLSLRKKGPLPSTSWSSPCVALWSEHRAQNDKTTVVAAFSSRCHSQRLLSAIQVYCARRARGARRRIPSGAMLMVAS